MSRNDFSAGGGGGGSGFSLGPEQNEFATAAARNTYATANADWLALYNDDRSLWIQTGVNIQRRNAAGSAWETVTAVIRGPTGATSTVPGPAGSAGAAGAASTVPGPAGAASTVPGPIGPTGAPGTPGGLGTATPPTTIVDASVYTQHGAVTVGSWRDYDMLQFVFYNGTYYPAVLIMTAALKLANAAAKQSHLAFEQNTSMNVHSTDGSDDIAITFHNSGPALNANSTMTVFGWFAGNNGNNGIQGPIGPVGPGSTILAADEGVDLPNPITKLNAVGVGIVATEIGGVLTLTVVGGGGGMPATHTEQYLAGKATQNFVPNDFTGSTGVAYSSGLHTATLPAQQGAVYAAVARISTDPEPTYADVNSQGINAFSDFTKQAAEIEISGAMYEVWVSDYQIFVTGDRVEWR